MEQTELEKGDGAVPKLSCQAGASLKFMGWGGTHKRRDGKRAEERAGRPVLPVSQVRVHQGWGDNTQCQVGLGIP